MTSNLPVLYSFRRCPYAIRARLALAVSGIEYELREVVLKNKPPQLLVASAKGTVPVLVLAGGGVIDESLDVMRWALAQNDPLGWLNHAPLDDMLTLIAKNDGPFKRALDRYKYPHRYPLESYDAPAEFALSQRDEASRWLDTLDERIRSGGIRDGWIFGSHASLADMALLPFVRQFAHTDKSWFAAQPWPHIQSWLARFEASELFASVMQKAPAWLADD